MRAWLLLTLLAPTLAEAGAGSLSVGGAAGVVLFDADDIPKNSWYAAPRVGYWFTDMVAAELEIGASTGPTQVFGSDFWAVVPMAGVLIDPLPDAVIQPIVTAGLGPVIKHACNCTGDLDGFPHLRSEMMGYVGTGFIVPVWGPLSARGDLRLLVSGGPATDLYDPIMVGGLATVGLTVTFDLRKDRDRDGIPDADDECVDIPEDLDGFEDLDGCPDRDNDKDAIRDVDDSCPDDPEDLDGFEDDDGCPDLDNDHDGVLDVSDACPEKAGTIATRGCPDRDRDGLEDRVDACPDLPGPAPTGCPDRDGDGVVDPDDECPDDPGPPESFGCPDRDEDRVPTYRDNCPDEPAQEGIDPRRSDGCPARVYVSIDRIVIEERIFFHSGKSTIRSVSYELLREIAAVLNEYTQIKRVRIEGHTDWQGSDEYNLRLSQDRADAVKAFLMREGVDPERLNAVGYGETRPLADNETSGGRAANRRVEFVIVDQEVRGIKRADELTPEDKVEGDAP